MPKRNRDYRAEEERRNARAKARGFTSRAAERGALKREDYKRGGFESHKAYVERRAKAAEWASKRSRKDVSAFSAKATPEDVANYPFIELLDKQTSHQAYMQKLARYLHAQDPGNYPDEKDSAFWDNY